MIRENDVSIALLHLDTQDRIATYSKLRHSPFYGSGVRNTASNIEQSERHQSCIVLFSANDEISGFKV